MARPTVKNFKNMTGEICDPIVWDMITYLDNLFQSSASPNSTVSTYSWFSKMVKLYCPILIERLQEDDELLYPTDEAAFVKGRFKCSLRSNNEISFTEETAPLEEAQLFTSYRDLYHRGKNATPIAVEGLILNYGQDFIDRLTKFDYVNGY